MISETMFSQTLILDMNQDKAWENMYNHDHG